MSVTLQQNVVLECITCPDCGVAHAIPQNMRTYAYNHGGRWYCPNGHHIGWDRKDSQSVNDQLRKQLDQANRNTQHWRQCKVDADKDRQHVERQLANRKGQITKIKKRIANGVCPCCNRQFQNVARHMASQHPDYIQADERD